MPEVMDKQTKAKKAKAPAKTPEMRKQERRDRFVRLAPRRVNAAIKTLGYVANMGNRAGYEYTEQEANKITAALKEACEGVIRAFSDIAEAPKAFTL